ncbi:hypothetical protein BH11ACT4_BH11ACT4_25180 [soil metagenome]
MSGVALACVAVLLVGCAPQVELPPGPTTAEIEAFQAKASASWWDLMQPGVDPPPVRRVQYVTSDQQRAAVQECIDQAVALDASSQSVSQWVCYQRFPLDPSDPALQRNTLSPAQLEYLYSFFISRLVPCLRLLGYRVTGDPGHDRFIAESTGFPSWDPYYALQPKPLSSSQWANLLGSCPPPFAADLLVPQERSP